MNLQITNKKIGLSGILLSSSLLLTFVSSRFYLVFIGILVVYLLREFVPRKKVPKVMKQTPIYKVSEPIEIVLPEKKDEFDLLEKIDEIVLLEKKDEIVLLEKIDEIVLPEKIKEKPKKTVNVETKEKIEKINEKKEEKSGVKLFAICVAWFYPVVMIGSVINGIANKIAGSRDGHFIGMIFLAAGICMYIIIILAPFLIPGDDD